MGYPKALLNMRGETYLERIYKTLIAGGCEEVFAVGGAHQSRLRQMKPKGLKLIHNPHWAQGMRSSLNRGLRAMGHGAVVLTHVDRPAVQASTISILTTHGGCKPLVPTFRGQSGHPVWLPEWMKAQLLSDLKSPLRDVLRRCGVMQLNVDDPGILLNINTPIDHAIFGAMTHKTASHACIETRSV